MDTPEYADFSKRAWDPAADAFRHGDDRQAMRLLVDVFGGEGTFDKMPAEAQSVAMANAKFFKAATLSNDPTPNISKDKVRRLKMPVLIIQGEDTFAMSKLIVKELTRVCPRLNSS
jgi:pimeloyl-ACP methyl ester carboxylesterase